MSQSPDFARKLATCAHATEQTLDALLGPNVLPGETARPSRLLEAMRYASLGGGKRLRPFLVAETATMFGIAGPGVWRTAAALEMVHCYSLVHDDLPAMDNDDLRRGRPTVHKAYGEAVAILAGDALLTLAFDTLANPATHPSAEIRAALVLGLARASGIGGMVGGQGLDLAAEHSSVPLALEDVHLLQAMKTGALIVFAVEAGVLLGGADAAVAAALKAYARAIGAAFQIADDILDAEGDSTTLGKRAGKDMARNKATFVQVLGLEAARQKLNALVAEADAALERTGLGAASMILRQAAAFIAARQT